MRLHSVLLLLAVLCTGATAQYHFVPTPRAFAVTSDGTFYRSTGIRMGDGKIASILRSTDKGRTWEIRARFDTAKFVADLVALDTVLYGFREGRRIVESFDGGVTWTDLPKEHKLGLPSLGTTIGEPLNGHPLIVLHSDAVYLWDPATRTWSDSIECGPLYEYHKKPSWLRSGELVSTGPSKGMGVYDFATRTWGSGGVNWWTPGSGYRYASFGDIYFEYGEVLYKGDITNTWTWLTDLPDIYRPTEVRYANDSIVAMKELANHRGRIFMRGSTTKMNVWTSGGRELPAIDHVVLGPDEAYFLENTSNYLLCYRVWTGADPVYPASTTCFGEILWQDLPLGSPIHRVTDDHWLSVFHYDGQQQSIVNESRDHGLSWHPVGKGKDVLCTQTDALVVVNSNVSIVVSGDGCDFISTDGAQTYQPLDLQRIGTQTRNVYVHDDGTLTFASYDPTDQRWRHYRSTTLTGPATYLPNMDVLDDVYEYNLQPWTFFTPTEAYRVHFERDSMFILRTTDDGNTTTILFRQPRMFATSFYWSISRLSDNEIVVLLRTTRPGTSFWILNVDTITEPILDLGYSDAGIDMGWATSITRDAQQRLIVVDHLGNIYRYDENDANPEVIHKYIRTNGIEGGKQDRVQDLEQIKYPFQRAIIQTKDGFASCGEGGIYVSGTFATPVSVDDDASGATSSAVVRSGTLHVYPNPASASFTIDNVSESDDVRITDILGRPVVCSIVSSTGSSQRIVTLPDGVQGLVVVGVRSAQDVRSAVVSFSNK